MSTIVRDEQIGALLAEHKPAVDPSALIPARRKRGHLEAFKEVIGADGSKFRLVVRQSFFDVQDFSAILAWERPSHTGLFRLRRCNGRSHEHRNQLDGDEVFFDFHVHTATERYQLGGYDEEHYAQPTDAYVDLIGAIGHLLQTCAFEPPPQGRLL